MRERGEDAGGVIQVRVGGAERRQIVPEHQRRRHECAGDLRDE